MDAGNKDNLLIMRREILRRRVEHQFRRVVKCLSKADIVLHKWQVEGVRWMLNREQDFRCRGGFLFDDMGLGKTLETISVMIGNRVNKTLLIVPAPLINQWKDAIMKVLPNVPILLHHGSCRLTSTLELSKLDRLIVLTSYDLTYGRGLNISTILHGIEWDRLICDECHLLRNEKCKRSIGIKKLTATIRWGLTGTPVHNGERDFVNLFRWYGYRYDYIYKNLKRFTDEYTLRRTKSMYSDSLKIPGLDVKIHELDFDSDEEREFYRRVKGEVTKEFLRLKSMRFNMKAIFELLLRLRQTCIYPQLVINGYNKKYQTNIERWSGSVTKIQKLADMIQKQDGNEKTLVFSYFKDEMRLIREYLSKLGFNAIIIDGSVSISERANIIRDSCITKLENHLLFSGKNGLPVLPKHLIDNILGFTRPIDVLILQINAGSTGLNLQMFNHIYFTSPCWNPAIEDQAICRAYRLGQQKKVFVHKLVMKDKKDEEFKTIEERILNIQNKKRKVMCEILNDEELLNNGVISNPKLGQNNLTVEDFIDMFS